MRKTAPPPAAWLFLAGATIALLAAGFILPIETAAWRFALVVLAGIAGGSAVAAAIGRLLSRDWPDVVEDELLPAGLSMALVGLLALPLLFLDGRAVAAPFGADGWADHQAIWFSQAGIALRLLAFAGATVGLSFLMLREAGDRRRVPALGAPVLTALFALAVLDWVVLRPPVWWTALLPIGYIVNQMAAALAIAFIFHLVQGERERDEAFASLSTALISVALLALWIGYTQYLIAWYGNKPSAAAFYQSRIARAPYLLPGAAALHAVGALLLLLTRTRATMLLSALLLLAAHLLHAVWLAGEAAPRELAGWAAAALLALTWGGWIWVLARWVDARLARRKARAEADARQRPTGDTGA